MLLNLGLKSICAASDVQQKFRKLLATTPIKQEVPDTTDITDEEQAQSLVLHENKNNIRQHNKMKRIRSSSNSPIPHTHWHNHVTNADELLDGDGDGDGEGDLSSSASSAISLTMKPAVHKCNSNLYQELLIKQEQPQRPETTQQQQKYLDELQQTHQQQLTANLFMARTIALSRSRDFPDIFQNSPAAAVAAAAAAAATANSAAAAVVVANSNNNSNNYMLPCPLCETPLEQRVFRQHLDRHYPRDSPVCPVIECGRRFAHPNSVRNHMRIKHTLQWAKMKAMRSSGGPFAGGSGDFK